MIQDWVDSAQPGSVSSIRAITPTLDLIPGFALMRKPTNRSNDSGGGSVARVSATGRDTAAWVWCS